MNEALLASHSCTFRSLRSPFKDNGLLNNFTARADLNFKKM